MKNLSEILKKGKQKPSAHMRTHGAAVMNDPGIEFDNIGVNSRIIITKN